MEYAPHTPSPRPKQLKGLMDNARRYLGPLGWGTAIVFVIQRGTDVANLICKIFLGRVLPPMDFGAFEPLLSTAALLALPAAIIFGTAVKSISRLRSQGEDAKCRALIHHLTIISTIGSVLSIACTLLLKDFILTRLHLDSDFFIWMLCLLFVGTWWGALINCIIRAEQRYRLLSVNSLITPFAIVATTILFTGVWNLGLKGAVGARVLTTLAILLFLIAILSKSNRGSRAPYPEERTLMLQMLIPMAALAFNSTLAGNFDRLFVRNFMVEESAGISAIFTLGQIPRLLLSPLGFVLLPVAAAQHASGRQLGRMLVKTIAISAILTAACCIGFALFSTPVLHFWKPIFAPYGRFVWIYALMTGLQSLCALSAQVEFARSRYRFLWLMAPPVPLACAALYLCHDYLHLPVTLDSLLWILTAANGLALVATLAYLGRTRVLRGLNSCNG
jgi:O-antigen/teichoic acid export membrane protein